MLIYVRLKSNLRELIVNRSLPNGSFIEPNGDLDSDHEQRSESIAIAMT